MKDAGSYNFKDSKLKPKKDKQVLAKLKIWLLEGNTITPNQALKKFRTSRLASYIHRLRKHMDIKMKRIYSGSDQYAEYSISTNKKKQKF